MHSFDNNLNSHSTRNEKFPILVIFKLCTNIKSHNGKYIKYLLKLLIIRLLNISPKIDDKALQWVIVIRLRRNSTINL